MCVQRAVVWIQFIVKRFVHDLRMGQFQFSCNIAWPSPRLSCLSWQYGTFIDCWHYGPRAFTSAVGVPLPVWWRRCYNIETHQCLEDVDVNNVRRIHTCQYHFEYYGHRGLRAFRCNSSCVYSTVTTACCCALCVLSTSSNALERPDK